MFFSVCQKRVARKEYPNRRVWLRDTLILAHTPPPTPKNSAAATLASNNPEPLNAAAATTESELTPPYSLQRQSATTPATIAAMGKPRPANGSLKKNILANDASSTPPPRLIAVT